MGGIAPLLRMKKNSTVLLQSWQFVRIQGEKDTYTVP